MYLLIIILPLLGSKQQNYLNLYDKFNRSSVNKTIYFNKNYSTNSLNIEKLDPYFISGFINAKGSFILSFSEDSKSKTSLKRCPQFSIGLHEKDKVILEAIQNSLGGIVSITKHSEDAVKLKISSTKDVLVLINFLEKFNLITQKYADFLLFK